METETYRRSVEARRSGRYTAVSELLSGGEALGVTEVLRALVLCVAAECSARRREARSSGEDGECEERGKIYPLLYLLGKGERRFGIDCATISVARWKNGRTLGRTISCGW